MKFKIKYNFKFYELYVGTPFIFSYLEQKHSLEFSYSSFLY